MSRERRLECLFAFRKSFKIFPGVRLNINRGSLSITTGSRGGPPAHQHPGRETTSMNLPGPLGWRRTRRRRR
ncbi:DUF4236 domain-containing protein [Nocardia uniformis]|uniref:DUF4236 domain-containing protein n=1 Tax=Nocardia uniformis TaxID=53432 RepID=A0A849C8U7_9NOCA|nr:DUF4236 domain-containing protein [Nocardia uniformis]